MGFIILILTYLKVVEFVSNLHAPFFNMFPLKNSSFFIGGAVSGGLWSSICFFHSLITLVRNPSIVSWINGPVSHNLAGSRKACACMLQSCFAAN
ncbi:hypothetical protein RchiOBHm_Chr4g0415921 [Rosa chinensis]|uniref:Uncharacterized protein n=1 Tax=Rosa chinensis TaxID=74649 RepID=A0A2P6QWR0_ROSCH|nr:hypothetical protein RchiOBHm_Chr4g0415921 [Rosa chinensis]